ncbi:MAG: cell division protein FtsL [Selenomonadaceae bacterium]|nr:cell division protein FtsL [Selenomonadaceae bacterium]
MRRTPKNNPAQSNQNVEIQSAEKSSKLRLIKYRPKLNHLLRSRCRVAFVVISILAMLVVIRSGISASRGYALVATQNQAQQLELENERLKIEIAKLKSPSRIKQIAQEELGMDVPQKMYFSH